MHTRIREGSKFTTRFTLLRDNPPANAVKPNVAGSSTVQPSLCVFQKPKPFSRYLKTAMADPKKNIRLHTGLRRMAPGQSTEVYYASIVPHRKRKLLEVLASWEEMLRVTLNCVHQLSMQDQWHQDPVMSWARFHLRFRVNAILSAPSSDHADPPLAICR
jgi:hypothetical protein